MKKRRMISIISMLVCSVIIAGVFFFIGYKTAYDRIENSTLTLNSQTFYATISNIQDHSLRVKGLEVNDINFRGDFIFSAGEETMIMWRYTDISFEDLKKGDNIAITFTGVVMESYPGQITQVELIQLLDDEI